MCEMVSMGSGLLCIISIYGAPDFPCYHISHSVMICVLVFLNWIIYPDVPRCAHSVCLSGCLWLSILSPWWCFLFYLVAPFLLTYCWWSLLISYFPDWVGHIPPGNSFSFLSCGWLLFQPTLPSVMIGGVLYPSLSLPFVLLQIIYYLLLIISPSILQLLFQVLTSPYMTHLRL